MTLTLRADTARNFNSADLKAGSPDKGLHEGTGLGEGDWGGLGMTVSEPHVRVSTLVVQTDDGLLLSIHDRIPWVGFRHPAPFFESGEQHAAAESVAARQPERGSGNDHHPRSERPGGGLGRGGTTLEAGAARTVDVVELEEGGEKLTGAFGDGTGNTPPPRSGPRTARSSPRTRAARPRSARSTGRPVHVTQIPKYTVLFRTRPSSRTFARTESK